MVWKQTSVPSLSKMTRSGLKAAAGARLAWASATLGDTAADISLKGDCRGCRGCSDCSDLLHRLPPAVHLKLNTSLSM